MPLHFLWGDEDFLIERSIKKIVNNVLGSDVNEFNYKTVDNPPFAEFSELLRTNSLMFGSCVIKINCSTYFLEIKNKQKLDDKQNQELINCFNNVSPNVTIILVCPTPKGEKKKPDSRKKIYKELSKVAKIEEFQTFKSYEENKLIPVVKKMAQEFDLTIDSNNCSFLIQTSGTYLRDINAQLEKLKLFLHPNKTIDENSIKQIASSNYDILKLSDLIIEKDVVNSLKLLDELLQKENYLPILAFLQSVVSNLLKIKIFSNHMNSFEISKKTGQMEFLVSKNIQKLSKTSIQELLTLRLNLLEIDYRLKNGIISNPILAFEMALLGEDL